MTTPQAQARLEFHSEMADFSISDARFERARHHISQMHQAAWDMETGSDEWREAYERIAEMRRRME